MVFFTNKLIETKLLIGLKVCSFEMNKGEFGRECILTYSV